MIDFMAYWGGVLTFFWTLFIFITLPIYILANREKRPRNPWDKKQNRNLRIVLEDKKSQRIDEPNTIDGDLYNED